MKSRQIEKNLALEFTYTLMGVAYYEQVTSDENPSNSRFSYFVSDFVKDQIDKIPLVIKNDLELFLKDFSCMYVTLLHLIIREDFTTPSEMMTYLSKLSAKDILNLYLEGNETGLTIDTEKSQLLHTLSDLSVAIHQNARDSELFFEFLNYPYEIFNRFTHAMEVMYTSFFQPFEPVLIEKLDALIVRHQALYDENPEAFINAILFQSKESLANDQADIHIYLCYFYGNKVSVAYSNDQKLYFFYGAGAEKKLYTKNLTAKYEELIKSLADETRRNLIRFLMHNPHYNKEISDHLGITTATISYHIGRLVDLGIIKHKYQEGKRIYYQVDKERFDQLFDGLKRYLSSNDLIN